MNFIKKLDTNDWQLYKSIRLECLKYMPWAFSARYADEVQKDDNYWQSIMANTQRMIFGFFKNNELVAISGMSLPDIWLSRYKENPQIISRVNNQDIKNNKTMIVSVYCTPSSRGNGYINHLLQHIINQQQSIHKGILYLAVEKNNLPAISLYKKLGFAYLEDLPPRIMADGNLHNEMLMHYTPHK
jgi:ribosomal protein S18 acetylase RimI-like enzyme